MYFKLDLFLFVLSEISGKKTSIDAEKVVRDSETNAINGSLPSESSEPVTVDERKQVTVRPCLQKFKMISGSSFDVLYTLVDVRKLKKIRY